MTFYVFMTLISLVGLIVTIVLMYKFDNELIAGGVCLFIVMLVGFVITIIAQPISLNKEQKRQTKEREQILYQVEHLTETSDKVKLNEWILTYNDWVNDINVEKETYGWVAWHYNFDMSKHQIINLV